MVLAAVLPELKRHLKYGSVLSCLPYQRDEKMGKNAQNKIRSSKPFNLGNLLHGVYVIFLLTFLFLKDSVVLPVERFVGGLMIAIFRGGYIINLEYEPDFLPMQV